MQEAQQTGHRLMTLLDLRLGTATLTDDQQELIRKRVVPILAGVAARLLEQQRIRGSAAPVSAEQGAKPPRADAGRTNG